MNVEPEKTHLLKEFKHDSPLLTCAFDPSGQFVFAGGRDRFVQRWEIATGNKVSLEAHETWVCAMAAWEGETAWEGEAGEAPAEPDSSINTAAQQELRPPGVLFTGDYTGRVVCWSLADDPPKVKWTIEAHQGTVRSVSVSPDGKILATAGKDGKVRLWSTDTGKPGKPAGELSGHTGQVYCVAFHRDGQLLASADRQSQHPTVRLWNLQTQHETGKFDASDLSAYRRYENIEWGGVRDVTFSPDGNLLACCGRHKYAGPAAVLLFDHRNGKQTEKLVSTFKAIFHRVMFHPNGFLIAAGGAIKSGELWFWNPKDEQSEPKDQQPKRDKDKNTTTAGVDPVATINVSGPANDCDLHPGGRRIVVAQSVGKSTYPDSGIIGVYEMSAELEVKPSEESLREG